MLLAAGFGRRMVPVTLFRAKPALPFLNRPLLARALDGLAAHGVTEVVVNIHHRPESLLPLLAERPGLGIRVSRETELLGTSGGLARAADAFRDGGTFLCVNSDVVTDIDFRAAVAAHREGGAAATLVLTPWRPGCGHTPVHHDGRRVLAFGGPPPAAAAGRPPGIFTGVHLLEPALLERLPAGRSEFLPALYEPMIAAGDAPAVHLATAVWREVGRPAEYLAEQIEALAATGDAALVLRGPDCRIDPTARLGPGCILGSGVTIGAGSHLEACVLMDGVEVGAEARLAQVIAGPGTRLPARCDLNLAVVDGGDPALPLAAAQPAVRWEGVWRVDF